jgi:hypothetical protein
LGATVISKVNSHKDYEFSKLVKNAFEKYVECTQVKKWPCVQYVSYIVIAYHFTKLSTKLRNKLPTGNSGEEKIII